MGRSPEKHPVICSNSPTHQPGPTKQATVHVLSPQACALTSRSGPTPNAMNSTLILRIKSRIQIDGTTQCWNWPGSTAKGYGQIKYGGVKLLVHRVMAQTFLGKGCSGFVLHRCDNRLCCNPDHLFFGTHVDNMDDMKAKGRSTAGRILSSSKLTPEKARAIRDSETGSQSQIAMKYGVTRSTVSQVQRRKTWANA